MICMDYKKRFNLLVYYFTGTSHLLLANFEMSPIEGPSPTGPVKPRAAPVKPGAAPGKPRELIPLPNGFAETGKRVLTNRKR